MNLKKILVFIFVCILIFPSGLTAKERRGADLLVQKKDGQSVRGELITVKNSSLLLLPESGSDVSVDVVDIKFIKVAKKSKALLGAGLGWVAGTSCLLVTAYAQDNVEVPFGEALLISLAVNIPTALLGAGVGSILGTDKTIKIEGKTETEIQEDLEYLRKKARVRNFQ